ncbi:hypothetical protein [Sporomusa termitida]|uniref:Uncharacterized protein n=1 Tax=Sporomusa termitida TaxID=2377 RepID=A0A517DSF5_9FIRM|nr:hypothetical protein [Sporomusa termitida]QDR80216.1 hypothetical protein SPTER_15350 [Sporomusa termitida]
MEYCSVPINWVKPVKEVIKDQELYFATQHGDVVTRKATAADIARIEAEIAAKGKRVKLDICGELELNRKPEIPDMPFEEITRKPRRLEPQYNPVEFGDKVG